MPVSLPLVSKRGGLGWGGWHKTFPRLARQLPDVAIGQSWALGGLASPFSAKRRGGSAVLCGGRNQGEELEQCISKGNLMRRAIFSDIHANLEALEEAVVHSKRLNVEQYAVLGDTVGYGANPNECFKWALENASTYILGNHEKALVDLSLVESFTDLAREAILWTRKVIDPLLLRRVEEMPYLKIEKGAMFTHGSPDQPEEFHYLLSFQDAVPSFQKMENSICFVGHTHVPSCFCENTQTASYLRPGVVSLKKGERYILNPGSIGQPRDRDPRLSFGIFDEEKQTFEIVRLPYDNQKAAQKIRQAGLPAYLADRLL